jgi:outer membrane protein TolC
MKIRFGFAVGALATSLLVAGCASTNGLSSEGSLRDANALAAENSLATAPLSPAAWARDDWWTAFNDPQLDALIAEALAESPTLRVAAARTRKALAYAETAKAPLYPHVDGEAEITRRRTPEHGLTPPPFGGRWGTLHQLQVTLDWELDFWARIAPRTKVRWPARAPPQSTLTRPASHCRSISPRRTSSSSALICSSTSRSRR